MRLTVVFAIALAAALVPSFASAQSVTPGTPGYEAIEPGVFEIGLNNILLINYKSAETNPDTEDSQSSLSATYIGGITPRYFVARNLAVAVDIDLFLARQDDTVTNDGEDTTFTRSDIGVLGTVMANYYIRLGYGMFFKPGLGGGGFFGKRSLPGTEPGTSVDSTLSGGAVRLDLGLVYYTSAHFNLKAGLDGLLWFGSDAPAEGDATSFSRFDGGFSVGFGYSF